MYTGLKHLHLLLIFLFVASIMIKALLLLINQQKFESYRKKTKVPEMVITMLFLVTGVIMIFTKGWGGLHYFFHIKLFIMLIAIPLAIIGFKKKNKILGLISAFLFVITIGFAFKAGDNMKEVHLDPSTIKGSDPLAYGKAMYEANCAACHGVGGAKQLDGAADLSNSDSEYSALQIGYIINEGVVEEGVTKMNAFKSLDSTEVKAISEYVITLRK